PYAPPDYSDLAVSEEHRQGCLQGSDRSQPQEEPHGSLLAYITEFRYLPPPLYSEGKHGSVRYWVKAELQRSWLLPVKVKKEFIAPQAGTKEKTLCCWFCASGPISISAKIERKGYTPGESIQIFAEVENCSSRVVIPKAALYQTQTFYAKGKGKQIQQLVANLRGDPLPQGKSQSWEGKSLKIPPVSPSIIDCPIIRVEYALMVYVDVPGGLNLNLSLPLVIGTIPLHACSSRTSTPPDYSDLAVSEEHRQGCLQGSDRSQPQEEPHGSLLAYITEFRYLPPPLYSEVDPYPDPVEGEGGGGGGADTAFELNYRTRVSEETGGTDDPGSLSVYRGRDGQVLDLPVSAPASSSFALHRRDGQVLDLPVSPPTPPPPSPSTGSGAYSTLMMGQSMIDGDTGGILSDLPSQLWLLPCGRGSPRSLDLKFELINLNACLCQAPQAGTKEKTLCCWFCASGPISISAKIERKGYTPGVVVVQFCVYAVLAPVLRDSVQRTLATPRAWTVRLRTRTSSVTSTTTRPEIWSPPENTGRSPQPQKKKKTGEKEEKESSPGTVASPSAQQRRVSSPLEDVSSGHSVTH
ncbi:hypothetical protein CRUP_026098, partial [Coryphaenoides rupestris]